MMLTLDTLVRRWPALVSVAMLVWAAWPEGGWRRVLRFLVVAFIVSLGAEYCSTHTCFPFGRFDYVADTHGRELYLGNIPLFVPVAYGTIVYAGRAIAARFTQAPVTLALVGGLATVLLDAAFDPMMLRGSLWLVGSLYRYRADGPWFGVPWSNFGGWFLVAASIILIDARVGGARLLVATTGRGRILACSIGILFVGIALWTRQPAIAAASAVITGVLVLAAGLPRPGS